MAAARPGDWQCVNTGCINHVQFPTAYVFGSKVNCTKCGTGKSAVRAGDWCCPNPQCVNHHNTVYGSKANCSKCGAAKPELNARGTSNSPYVQGSTIAPTSPEGFPGIPTPPPPPVRGHGGVPVPRIGDWHCANPSCKNHADNLVFASKSTCPLCGTPKPAPPPMPPTGMPQPEEQAEQDWPAQTFSPYVEHHVHVQHMSPVVEQAPRPGRPRTQPGDWNCANPSCKNHLDNFVYASKLQCPLCGAGKPEHAQHAGTVIPPTPSMLRPGDWQCPNVSCKNHINGVYASKSACSICGMMNPAAGERPRSRSPRHV